MSRSRSAITSPPSNATDWVNTQREDDFVDLWPEHAERLVGAKEFWDGDHKGYILYLDIEPLALDVEIVTYMSWTPPFTGNAWLREVFRPGNLSFENWRDT